MAVKLKWTPRVLGDAQRIYRSQTPFAADALPAMLAEIPAGANEYTDETAPAGDLYYRVSAVVGSREAVGDLAHNFTAGAVVPDGPDPMPPVWVARPLTGVINSHQGVIALDNGNFVTIDNNALYLRDAEFKLIASNTQTSVDLGQSGTPGYKLADMYEYDGKLWIMRYDNIEAWDATTLAYSPSDKVAVAPSSGFASHCAGPVVGDMYAIQYVGGAGATFIRQVNLATGATVQDIPLSTGIINAQGITYHFEKFYVTANGNQVYEVEPDGTVNGVIATITGGNTIEGISGRGDSLYILFDGGLDEIVELRRYTTPVPQTSGQTTGNVVVNGDLETGDFSGWIAPDYSLGTVLFGGGVGGKPDSNLARGNIFRMQSFLIPQEAWDQVDAGNATLDLAALTFGSGSGTVTLVTFDADRTQLDQANPTYQSGNWTAWADRSVTGMAVSPGARSFLVAMVSGSSNWYADEISAQLNW